MLYEDVLSAIGETPIIRLNRLNTSSAAVYAKIEGTNPGGSMKDRSALGIIEAAKRQGLLRPGGTIVESTSGSFGVSIAMICAAEGYRVICVADPKLTPANRLIIEAFGGEIVLVETKDENGGYLLNRIRTVRKILKDNPDAFWPNQYENLAGPFAYVELAEEIFRDVPAIDYFVAAVSTAGSIMGTGRALKQRIPTVKIVAVDADGSVIFGGKPKPRYTTGFGSSMRPPLLDLYPDLIDEIFTVTDEEAFITARLLARHEGILAGGSSGAVTAVALKIAQQANPGAVIVTLLPDRGERYLHQIYDDAWMRRHGFLIE